MKDPNQVTLSPFLLAGFGLEGAEGMATLTK